MAKMGGQTILEEEFDENYEPTNEDVAEYASFLGMDLEADKELLWIAREGLKAPLPEEWKPCQTEDKEIYYFNFKTGESEWEHPCDKYYKNMFQKEKEKQLKQKRSGSKPKKRSGSGSGNGSSGSDAARGQKTGVSALFANTAPSEKARVSPAVQSPIDTLLGGTGSSGANKRTGTPAGPSEGLALSAASTPRGSGVLAPITARDTGSSTLVPTRSALGSQADASSARVKKLPSPSSGLDDADDSPWGTNPSTTPMAVASTPQPATRLQGGLEDIASLSSGSISDSHSQTQSSVSQKKQQQQQKQQRESPGVQQQTQDQRQQQQQQQQQQQAQHQEWISAQVVKMEQEKAAWSAKAEQELSEWKRSQEATLQQRRDILRQDQDRVHQQQLEVERKLRELSAEKEEAERSMKQLSDQLLQQRQEAAKESNKLKESMAQSRSQLEQLESQQQVRSVEAAREEEAHRVLMMKMKTKHSEELREVKERQAAAVKSLEAEAAALEQRVADEQAALIRVQSSIADAERKLKDKVTLAQGAATAAATEAAREEMERSHERAMKQLKDAHRVEVEGIRQEHQRDLKSAKATWQAQYDRMQEQWQALDERTSSATENWNAVCTKVQQRLQTIQAQQQSQHLKMAMNSSSAASAATAPLEEANAKLTQEIISLQSRLAEEKRSHSRVREAEADSKREAESLSQRIRSLEAELSSQRRASDQGQGSIKRQADALQEQLRSAEKRASAAEAEAEAARSDKEEAVRMLKQEREQNARSSADLQKLKLQVEVAESSARAAEERAAIAVRAKTTAAQQVADDTAAALRVKDGWVGPAVADDPEEAKTHTPFGRVESAHDSGSSPAQSIGSSPVSLAITDGPSPGGAAAPDLPRRLAAELEVTNQIRTYLKRQRQVIRSLQSALLEDQRRWRAKKTALQHRQKKQRQGGQDSDDTTAELAALRKDKQKLDRWANELNSDVRQMKEVQRWLMRHEERVSVAKNAVQEARKSHGLEAPSTRAPLQDLPRDRERRHKQRHGRHGDFSPIKEHQYSLAAPSGRENQFARATGWSAVNGTSQGQGAWVGAGDSATSTVNLGSMRFTEVQSKMNILRGMLQRWHTQREIAKGTLQGQFQSLKSLCDSARVRLAPYAGTGGAVGSVGSVAAHDAQDKDVVIRIRLDKQY